MKKLLSLVAKSVIQSVDADKPTSVSAIIVAAGNSTRMGGVSKQLIDICGLPVIVRTAMAFESCAQIKEIIIVAKSDQISVTDELMRSHNITKFKCSVVGGDTRSESVKHGFEATDPGIAYVAIHDAARCLITPDEINNVIGCAKRFGAAIAAARSVDTLKLSSDGETIDGTIDRNTVWRAQTPQVFSRAVYETALYAQKNNATATDDAMLCENLGIKVHIAECTGENLKITTPRDVAIAESIINGRTK